MASSEEERGRKRNETEDPAVSEPVFRPLDYVGSYIERQRHRLGFSRIRLAEKAGVSDKTISNIEKGITKSPNAEILGAIFGALREPEDSSGLQEYARQRWDEALAAQTAQADAAEAAEQARKQAEAVAELAASEEVELSAKPQKAAWQKIAAISIVLVLALVAISFWFWGKTSERDSALNELQRRNVSLSPEAVAGGLRAGDAELLQLMTAAGISVAQVEAAFVGNADAYFKNTDGNADADNWFSHVLQLGLNPELRVSDTKYEEVGLLYAALKNGNANAALALIEAGASPHAYQTLVGRRSEQPYFLFPAQFVSRSELLSGAEKEKVIRAMFERTVAFYDPPKLSAKNTPAQTSDSTVIRLNDEMERLVGYAGTAPKEVPLSCAFQRKRERCEAAGNRTGKDWCSVMDEVPSVINVTDEGLSDIYAVYVQDLINVSKDSAYFFVTQLGGYKSVLGLLEVTPDRDRYNLILRGSKDGRGIGSCDGSDGGNIYAYCWQKWPIVKTGESNAIVRERYEAKLISSCQREGQAEVD